MKLIILLSTLFSLSSFSLVFKKNNKLVKKTDLKEMQSFVKSVYDVVREKEFVYTGYDFYKVMNEIYGKEWKAAKIIVFKALDGYAVAQRVEKLLNTSKGKFGLIAYGEKGKKGFTTFKKGNRNIKLGPYYIVWTNIQKSEAEYFRKELKWPYQVKEINLKF